MQGRRRRVEETLLLGVIWALVGSIYAGLFVVFLEFLYFSGLGKLAFPAAGAMAGAVGAAFYGAMQIAILGTLAGVIANFAYMVSFGDQVTPLGVLAVAGGAGAALGSVFGAMHLSLVRGALSKALAGMFGGLLAALILWGVGELLPVPVRLWMLAGFLVPITGYLYVAVVGPLESKLAGRVPGPLVGALVAGSLASVVGGSAWAVGGTITDLLPPEVLSAIEQALAEMPAALLAGAVGGWLAGTLLGLVGRLPP